MIDLNDRFFLMSTITNYRFLMVSQRLVGEMSLISSRNIDYRVLHQLNQWAYSTSINYGNI